MNEIEPLRTGTVAVVPLDNPLEIYRPFIDDLLGHLNDSASPHDLESHILESVRRASHADFVFILRANGNGWSIKAQSAWAVESQDQSAYVGAVIPRVLGAGPEEQLSSSLNRGMYYLLPERPGKAVVAIPLCANPNRELMLVCDVPQDPRWLGDPYGRILTTLYTATHKLTTLNCLLVEAAILDDLKRTYGLVPSALGARRLALFWQRLKQVRVHFQPVLYLHDGMMEIDSWEALARDPDGVQAPRDLFDAAELWGNPFMVELDTHLIALAARSYRAAYLRAKEHGREGFKELSANVYPASLMRKAYYDAIKELLKERVIPPRKLVLEISERTPIPAPEEGSAPLPLMALFKERLQKYVLDFGIAFAIDDFGVGHASVARLAQLNPAYVKIDRDILLHEYGDTIIRFVLDVSMHKGLRLPKVVVEGFDDSSLITLNQLYRLGVRWVQGYLIGRPGPELHPLAPELAEYLARLMVA